MSSISELQYHKGASEEVRDAYLWYAERDRKTARLFASEINLAIEKIRRSPKRWPRFDGDVRRYVLHGFPFQIIYYLDAAGTIYVLAVAHTRKRPGYWIHRK
jgi:plasmid stabilization system protein ParE